MCHTQWECEIISTRKQRCIDVMTLIRRCLTSIFYFPVNTRFLAEINFLDL